MIVQPPEVEACTWARVPTESDDARLVADDTKVVIPFDHVTMLPPLAGAVAVTRAVNSLLHAACAGACVGAAGG